MPSNTRGKIKEHILGIHKDTEAIKAHIAQCMELVGDKNPTVSLTFTKLGELNEVLDEFAMRTYGSI